MENNFSRLENIGYYCSSHPEANLIVDTGVLLLFLVGIYDPDYIEICPLFTENGKFYKKGHFELIKEILQHFPNKIIITPHVLSEVNMLRKKISQERRNDYLVKMIQELDKHQEHCVPLKILLGNGAVVQFDFTDVSLVEATGKNNWILLTDDLPLYVAFNAKVPMINFNSVVAMEQLK